MDRVSGRVCEVKCIILANLKVVNETGNMDLDHAVFVRLNGSAEIETNWSTARSHLSLKINLPFNGMAVPYLFHDSIGYMGWNIYASCNKHTSLFGTLCSPSPPNSPSKGGEIIKQDNIKFLGIFVDHKLNWNKHMSFVKSKLSPGLYLLNTNKHKLRSDVLRTIYFSLF